HPVLPGGGSVARQWECEITSAAQDHEPSDGVLLSGQRAVQGHEHVDAARSAQAMRLRSSYRPVRGRRNGAACRDMALLANPPKTPRRISARPAHVDADGVVGSEARGVGRSAADEKHLRDFEPEGIEPGTVVFA